MKSHHHILGLTTAAQAERVLSDLANVPDLPPLGTVIAPGKTDQYTAWVERMQKQYPQIFGNCSVADMFALRRLIRAVWDSADPRQREWFCFLLRQFHAEIERRAESFREDPNKLVRDAQAHKDRLENFLRPGYGKTLSIARSLRKVSGIIRRSVPVAQMLYNLSDGERVAELLRATPPALSEFEKALFHLQRNLNHALRCKNPVCAMPYFFSHEKGQEYCSESCANYARRESKRRWWHENRANSKRSKSKPKNKTRR